MQLPLWSIVALIAAGTLLLSVLMHRKGFSRAVALGFALAVLGGTALVTREPIVDSSEPTTAVATAPETEPASNAPRPEPATPPPAARTTDIAPVRPTRPDPKLDALQDRITALEATAAEDRAALQKAGTDLDAARSRVTTLEAENRRLAADIARNTSAPPAQPDALQAAERRLAIAEAEIMRLKAALRAAEPVPTAALPTIPAPFSHAPPRESEAEGPSSSPAAPAANTTPARPAAGEPAATVGQTIAEAARSNRFTLIKLSGDEWIAGRRASYYRIVCAGNNAKPLRFGSGDYQVDAGALNACYRAIRQLLLDRITDKSGYRLYVQAYASHRGFIRPKALRARDTQLKTIAYLPREKGRDRFAASPARQQTGARYANRELPILRAAFVANWIAAATKDTPRPEILEGELKPDKDALVQGFALVLAMTW